MLITSKHQSVCKACSRSILPGDRISWVKGVKGAEHAACSSEGKALAAKLDVSSATNAVIDVPLPEGLSLLPYQRAGVAYALQHEGTLIADEMGLGKTVQAIGVINADPSIETVLIVCPASLKFNWRNELRKWLVGTRFEVLMRVGVFPETSPITVINYDQLHKLDASQQWDLLILDEAHYAKNIKSRRGKLVKALAKRCKRKIALTGTPIENRPIELFPILSIIDPKNWDPAGKIKGKFVEEGNGAGFFRFAKRYCNATKQWVGKWIWDFSGASNLDELQEKLRTTCMVRRKKSAVLTELPAKRRQVIILDPTSDEEDCIADERVMWGNRDLHSPQVEFAEMSGVRHRMAIAKVDQVVEHVRNVLENSTGKVIVFGHHKEMIEGLFLGTTDYYPVVVDGSTAIEDRQASVEKFQNDPSCRVFIGSIRAAGTGLTLTASSHVIFAELDWNPAIMSQCEDRAHRIGQLDSVLVQLLCVDGSLDARMSAVLIAKQQVADLALDTATMQDVSGRPTVESSVMRVQDETREDFTISAKEIGIVHRQLRYLAGQCDGAVELDGVGFNGIDSDFGKALAACERLSARQALAARKMLKKYRRQLSDVNET